MAVYLDHAATSPLRPPVLETMLPRLHEATTVTAREIVAHMIGAQPREIVFTAGGTEADNLAIKGVAWAATSRGRHVITTAVEHKAVINATAILERSGFDITILPRGCRRACCVVYGFVSGFGSRRRRSAPPYTYGGRRAVFR